MELNIKNPLIFFDLETTGIDTSKDRIVEISMLKIFPDKSEEVKTRRINPGIPIPLEASLIHKIYDEDVKDCPSFKDIAKSLAVYIEGCDFAGYNSNKFDLPLLVEEFLRAGIDIDLKKRKFIDVQNIFHKKEQRTLIAAYKFYCDKDLTDAHSAEADTRATYEVLLSQLEKYGDLANDVQFLSDYSRSNSFADYAGRVIYDNNGTEVFNFGKHKGKPVEEVFRTEPSYYAWIMNGDFPAYTKKVVTAIKLRSLERKK